MKKKPFERFLITVDFKNRFETAEYIVSFSVVCVNLCTGIDVSADLLFFEDSDYQELDVDYGVGLYGGMQDNMESSITFGIKDGVVGNKYKITVKVFTDIGNKLEEDVILEIISQNNNCCSQCCCRSSCSYIEFYNAIGSKGFMNQ